MFIMFFMEKRDKKYTAGEGMGNSASKMRERKQQLESEFAEFWVDMPDQDARIKRFLRELGKKEDIRYSLRAHVTCWAVVSRLMT